MIYLILYFILTIITYIFIKRYIRGNDSNLVKWEIFDGNSNWENVLITLIFSLLFPVFWIIQVIIKICIFTNKILDKYDPPKWL
jgi:hypothetical protein